MQIRVISVEIFKTIATPDRVIDWVRKAQIATSNGEAILPLRRAFTINGELGTIGMMLGYLAPVRSAGIKLVSLVPPERRKGSSHLGLYILYDQDGLVPVALMDGSVLTSIRTAAASAVATDALSRQDANTLAILGTGEQAEAHIEALSVVRSFSKIHVWGRTSSKAEALCELMLKKGYPCIHSSSVDEAVSTADVICTVTSSSDPVLFGDMIAPGTHINLVGSSHRNSREVDTNLLLRSTIFLDYEASAKDQAGELLTAIADKAMDWKDVAGEIGLVLSGKIEGRRSEDEITLYKSLGIAAQDIITARKIYEQAVASDLGNVVSL